MPNLIVLRGPPAVGKTTLVHAIKRELIKQNIQVASLHWDEILYLLGPVKQLDDSLIIATTFNLIEFVKSIIKTRPVEIVIIDGVFLHQEEHILLQQLLTYFTGSLFIRLYCDSTIQLVRNQNRNPEDFLDINRLKTVTDDPRWATFFTQELMLNTDTFSISVLTNLVIKEFNKKQFSNNSNPTLNHVWKLSAYLRFPLDQILLVQGISFSIQPNKNLNCLAYFEIPENKSLYDEILNLILKQNYQFKFPYLDKDSSLFTSFFSYIEQNSLRHRICIKVLDEWLAPVLSLPKNSNLKAYFNTNYRLKRTLNKLEALEDEFFLKFSSFTAPEQLWVDMQRIENQSWKYREQSHMQGLNREDLCYFFPLISNPQLNSLCILYDKSDEPLSYSLMVRASVSSKWYAAKWGATERARNRNLGIKCLLIHLQELFNQSSVPIFEVDFWGRNQPIYEQLKNTRIKRCHLELSKK